MIEFKFKSLSDFDEVFKEEQDCIKYLEWVIWKGNPVSPYDSNSKVYKCKNNNYKCKNTNQYFNVKTNTMFHRSSIPLKDWFKAIWFVTFHKKGISSIQLGKDIGVTQKTAWHILQRIRNCFKIENESELSGTVQIDETFIGGKNKNRHWDKKVTNSQGRSYKDKTPVFGMLQVGGKVVAKVVENTKAKTLRKEIFKTIKKGSTIHSDEWYYGDLSRRYKHHFINHRQKQYADGDITTNAIEGFWSLLKRGYMGIYHYMSRKHLQRYVDEFVFRYNTRNFPPQQVFEYILSNANYRLTYKKLTYA